MGAEGVEPSLCVVGAIEICRTLPPSQNPSNSHEQEGHDCVIPINIKEHYVILLQMMESNHPPRGYEPRMQTDTPICDVKEALSSLTRLQNPHSS